MLYLGTKYLWRLITVLFNPSPAIKSVLFLFLSNILSGMFRMVKIGRNSHLNILHLVCSNIGSHICHFFWNVFSLSPIEFTITMRILCMLIRRKHIFVILELDFYVIYDNQGQSWICYFIRIQNWLFLKGDFVLSLKINKEGS